MAAKEEVLECIEKLEAAFPSRKIGDTTTQLYVENLENFEGHSLRRATENWIRSGDRFPTIAQLREATKQYEPSKVTPSNSEYQEPKRDASEVFASMVRRRMLRKIEEFHKSGMPKEFGVLQHPNPSPGWREWLKKAEVKAIAEVKEKGYLTGERGYRSMYGSEFIPPESVPDDYDPFALSEFEEKELAGLV